MSSGRALFPDIIAVFPGCFCLPVENLRFANTVFEAPALVKWYAREHVLWGRF